MFFNCIMGNEGFSICIVWWIKGTLILTIPFIISVSVLNWECSTFRLTILQVVVSLSKTKQWRKPHADPSWCFYSQGQTPHCFYSILCLFPPFFNILKWHVSHAISMNMKSIQIKSKGKDTVLGPLIQLDAALFGALCWWIMDESEN